MSIEVDVLNGNTSWPVVEPLFKVVWSPEIMANKPWRHIKWANADLRVLVETPDDGLACHVGIYFRDVTWNGRANSTSAASAAWRRIRINAVMAMPASRSTRLFKPCATMKRLNLLCCSASRTISRFISRVAGIPSKGKSTPNNRKAESASRPCHPSYST